MAEGRIKNTELSAIAAAIRSKNGEITVYKPAEMAQAILDIPTGGSAVIESKNITANGTYTAPTGVDGYSPVTVAVQPNLQSKTATENGTVTPDSGYDGLSSVVVNVSGGSGDDWTALKNYIESSGTQWIDTGYTVQTTSKLGVVFESSDTTHVYSCVFGARVNSNDNDASQSALLALSWNNGYINPMWGTGATSLIARSNIVGKKVNAELSASGISIHTSGMFHVGTALSPTYSPTDQYPLWLFNLNDHGSDYGYPTHCSMKLYRFRIYENDTLVHEFIPWQDDNNVACLKDTITGNLKYNIGTGSFTYGTDS